MTKRKSIVSSFGDFTSEPKDDTPKTEAAAEEKRPKPKRVAAGIIGTTQRTLTQIREERDALIAQAADSKQVLVLDPSLIDPSPFRDRLPDDGVSSFEAFKASLSEEGQKVPITVRRHTETSDRFQVVYGHRRLRALKELALPVQAIVADYSDRDLVIAQGIENANRQDLSWIEKALFADEMQSAGIKPKDIKAALGIDDAELSKFRSVLKSVPSDLVEAIGRAPSIGRPRWLEFAGLLTGKQNLLRVQNTLSADKVSNLASDERFVAALASLEEQATTRPSRQQQANVDLGDVGSMTVTPSAVKINLDKKHRDGFSKFLEEEMKDLVERYKRSLIP